MAAVRDHAGGQLQPVPLRRAVRLSLHGLLLGGLFFLIGLALLEFGYLRPAGGASITRIEIQATGERNKNSKGGEVWFHGAFHVGEDGKIPWDQFKADASWERRDGISLSFKDQPAVAALEIARPLRLQFGANPYSGIVKIKWGGKEKVVDLYSKENEVRDIIVDPRPTYKGTHAYTIISLAFLLLGFSLAVLVVLFEWRAIYRCLFCVFLVLSVYLTLAAFFPGVFSNDSADQLREAMSGSFWDWHPPLMAWVWALLIKATGSVESLLILHVLILTIGAIFWAKILEVLGLQYWTPFVAIVLVTPVVINFSGVLWKDVGFAFSLLLSCGIVGLAFAVRRISAARIVVVVCLVAYAFGVRTNGILAISPVIFMLVWTAVAQRKPKLSQGAMLTVSVGTAVLVLVGIVAGVQVLSYQYIKAQKRYPIQYLELYDIAGISSISGVDYFPEYVKKSPGYDFGEVVEGYANSIAWGNANNLIMRRVGGSPSLLPRNTDSNLQSELRDSWLGAIVNEPLAYLKHRFAVVNFLMGEASYPFEQPQSDRKRNLILEAHFIDEKNVPEISEFRFPGATRAKDFVSSILFWANGSFLYIGWFWFILLLFELLICLTVLRRSSAGLVAAMVSASGMLYVLPYFVVAPAADFRYLYWSAIAGGVSAILIAGVSIRAGLTKLTSSLQRL